MHMEGRGRTATQVCAHLPHTLLSTDRHLPGLHITYHTHHITHITHHTHHITHHWSVATTADTVSTSLHTFLVSGAAYVIRVTLFLQHKSDQTWRPKICVLSSRVNNQLFSSPDIYLGCNGGLSLASVSPTSRVHLLPPASVLQQTHPRLVTHITVHTRADEGCHTSVCAGAVSITGSCKGHCRHCCSSCSKQLTERVRVCTVRVLHILFILHRNKSLNLTLSLTVVLCQRMCVTVVK